MDNRIRIIIPGEAASRGVVFGVCGGCGVGVSGSPPPDTEREGIGREKALGDHGPRQRATNIQDGFPNRRGG